MTSTVLDVTVMLLCVSASVVALAGAADDPFVDRGPDGDRVADRLTTETATVTYDADSGAGAASDGPADGDATVHGTLAELLALAGTDDGTTRFASRAVATVSEAFGPRTRIDGRPDSVPSVGTEPPRGADVTTAVVSVPVPAATPLDADRVRFVIRVW